jgi:hypothetical protein
MCARIPHVRPCMDWEQFLGNTEVDTEYCTEHLETATPTKCSSDSPQGRKGRCGEGGEGRKTPVGEGGK